MRIKPLTIYLAGPISGLSYSAVVDRYKHYVKRFERMGYNVLFPMMGKGYLRNENEIVPSDYQQPISTNRAIVGRDSWMVHQCDILVADLSCATEVSRGTICEISWASLLHKHVLVALGSERNYDNPHYHAFVLGQADIVFSEMDEVIEYLLNFSEGLFAL